MAKVLDLPAIPPFSVTETSSLAQRWDKWTKSLEYYIRASGISDQKQKRAILLHLAGAEVQEIFETLPETGDDYKTALEKLTAHFNSCKNIAFERHVFRQATQKADETMDAYVTRLRTLSKTCEFGTSLDEMIRDQIIEKCASNALRRRLLRERELTLDNLLLIARSFELADRQALEIEQKFDSSTHLNSIERQSDSQQSRRNSAKHDNNNRLKSVCYCCGNEGHRAKDAQCPALNKTCRRCGKPGHFARVCRQTTRKPKNDWANARQLEQSDDDSSENECLFTLTANNVHHRSDSLHTLEIEHIPVQMLIDSGASVNVLDLETYHRLNARKGVQMMPTNLRVYAYGSTTPLNILGTVSGRVKCNSDEIVAKFVVVPNRHAGCLLGRQTATQLGLLRVGPQVSSINHAASPPTLRQQYPNVFDGVGKLTDHQQKISINDTIKPVAQSPRRIPFHVRKQVSAKLNELERLDIIEKVSGPTPWVSPLVVVPKSSGEIRVCVDMRQVNTAVIRERYPIPTIEESLQDLNGAAVFSKLDLKWGYHQIELDEKSRELTTFTTHDGLYRYKRLMFGISAAPEIYQHTIQQVLHGLPGVKNISDDIIVFGKDKSEHDKNLHGVLGRLQERGLTLNSEKCMFSVPEITFFGFDISARGIRPNNQSVEAIRNAPTPTNASEVRSFLGLASFCRRFIPDFSTIAYPLSELTRKAVQWSWTTTHQSAFDKLKAMLTSDCVMAHYDPAAPTQLRVDASPVGLGAILTQTQLGVVRPVAYASRTLTAVERRYSQTEREALAVVWGCEKFHLYLYGTTFDLLSDHKPLEVIYSPTSKPPARIERWGLRLQPYTFRLQYSPGATNPADMLSRLPLPNTVHRGRNIAEEYVHYIARNAVPKAMSLTQLQQATSQDPVLQQVHQSVVSGNWTKTKETHPYFCVKDELTATESLLLRGSRIVIPASLQSTALQLAHEGHQGIVRTKQLLREKVWWPGIDKDVEHLIRSCISCQAQSSQSCPQPLTMTEMPSRPWTVLHADLCGPFPSGESLLVLVDSCSRWPEVFILKSTTAAVIINRMKSCFAVHGLPEEIVTDNGPQFVAEEFDSYLRDHSITHRRVTPYWPQANSEVERFNRTLEKAIRAATTEGKDWKNEINTFLLNYRATPHCTTGKSPAVLLFGREIRTKLPSLNARTLPASQANVVDPTVLERDRCQKAKMKKYADEKRRAAPSNIKRGDRVLLKQERKNKLSTRYDPDPYVVVGTKGTSLLLKRRAEPEIMRNSSAVRKLPRDDNNGMGEHPHEADRGSDQVVVTTGGPRPQRLRKPPEYFEYTQV